MALRERGWTEWEISCEEIESASKNKEIIQEAKAYNEEIGSLTSLNKTTII